MPNGTNDSRSSSANHVAKLWRGGGFVGRDGGILPIFRLAEDRCGRHPAAMVALMSQLESGGRIAALSERFTGFCSAGS